MTCSRFSLKIVWFTGKVKYTRKKSISFFLYNPGCLGNKALFEDLASTQNHVRFTSELVPHRRIDWWGFHKDRALVLAPADGPLSHLWPLDWIFLTDFTPEVSNFQHFQPLQVLTETMISDKKTIKIRERSQRKIFWDLLLVCILVAGCDGGWQVGLCAWLPAGWPPVHQLGQAGAEQCCQVGARCASCLPPTRRGGRPFF